MGDIQNNKYSLDLEREGGNEGVGGGGGGCLGTALLAYLCIHIDKNCCTNSRFIIMKKKMVKKIKTRYMCYCSASLYTTFLVLPSGDKMNKLSWWPTRVQPTYSWPWEKTGSVRSRPTTLRVCPWLLLMVMA